MNQYLDVSIPRDAFPPGESPTYDVIVGRITPAEYEATLAAEREAIESRIRQIERSVRQFFVTGFGIGVSVGLVIGIAVGGAR